MLDETGQAGATDIEVVVTTEMRIAGALILSDPDLAFSAQEKAEAAYIAMVEARNLALQSREFPR